MVPVIDDEMLAGLAYVLTEQADVVTEMETLPNHDERTKQSKHRLAMYALRWAYYRDMHLGTEKSVYDAVQDAMAWRAANPDLVGKFVQTYDERQRERRRNGL